jgi:cytochrome c oxidase assembly protein subunit 15
VKCLGVAVLVAVVVQGTLGGNRVLLDSRGLAFVHGVFASWVFALMCSVALFTSKGWLTATPLEKDQGGRMVFWSGFTTAFLIAVQYVLGAMLRHRGVALYEHAGFALAVVFSEFWLLYAAARTGRAWLIRPAFALIGFTCLQLLVGVFTYMARFGDFSGNVAVQGSTWQIAIRTFHVFVGMFVWMTAVIYTLRAWRVQPSRTRTEPATKSAFEPARGLPLTGGVG